MAQWEDQNVTLTKKLKGKIWLSGSISKRRYIILSHKVHTTELSSMFDSVFVLFKFMLSIGYKFEERCLARADDPSDNVSSMPLMQSILGDWQSTQPK